MDEARDGERTRATGPGPWRTLALCVVLAGVMLRFVSLDRMVFWSDEVIHSHYAQGVSEREIGERVAGWEGRAIEAQALLDILAVDASRGPTDVVRALADEEPQSPPLHYLLLHYWTRLVGAGVSEGRRLSALLSLLALPCVFALGRELLGPRGALVLLSLYAVSPHFLLFAREVRYYAPWAAVVAGSTLLLLRASRRDRPGDWAAYAASVAVGLYLFPFTAAVAAAHGISLLAIPRGRASRPRRRWGGSLLAAAALWLPWFVQIVTWDGAMSTFREHVISVRRLVIEWAIGASRALVDLDPLTAWDRFSPVVAAVGLFTLVCVTLVLWRAPARVRLTVLPLLLCVWAPLALLDLAYGGIRSTLDRYLAPMHLGILLAVAWTLTAGLASHATSRRRAASVALLLVLGLGLASGVRIATSEIWWNKGGSVANPAIARLINSADRPLLVAHIDGSDGRRVVSLAHHLGPHVRLWLARRPDAVPPLPPGFDEVFVYDRPDELKRHLERDHAVAFERAYGGPGHGLLRVVPAAPIAAVGATHAEVTRRYRRSTSTPSSPTAAK